MNSLAAKILMALAVIAVPALLVAGILGLTLIDTVSDAESDFDHALSASRRITEIRVMIEKEYGLAARLPAELDQAKVDTYVAQIATTAKTIDGAIAALAANGRIVTPDAVKQIRAARGEVAKATAGIVNATKSFSQTTALELVNGPFEANTALAVKMLDAIASNVDAVAETARKNLKSSSVWALRLTPAGLLAVLLAVGFSFWMVRRSVVKPLRGIVKGMSELADGNFDVVLPGLGRRDEIGAMALAVETFKAKAIEKATQEAAEKEAQANAMAAARQAEMRKLADNFEAAVGTIVGVVSSTSTQLEAAASTLTKTAESTQMLTAVVASAAEEASSNVQSVASATEELVDLRQRGRPPGAGIEQDRRRSREAGRADRRPHQRAAARGEPHRRRRQAHHRGCRPDEPARPQCDDRSRARRRGRQRLCGGRAGGEGARRPDRQGDRRDRCADRQHADRNAGIGHRHQGNRRNDHPYFGDRRCHCRRGGGAERSRPARSPAMCIRPPRARCRSPGTSPTSIAVPPTPEPPRPRCSRRCSPCPRKAAG